MTDVTHELVHRLLHSRVGGLDASTEVIETHISIILLTAEFAYKLKKPVYYGFVDFRTLAQRKYYCEEEVRLNQRLAKDLYIGVCAVTGSLAKPDLDGNGPVIDYLVKMHRFPAGSELNKVIHSEVPVEDKFDAFTIELADFHRAAPRVENSNQFGSYEHIESDIRDNFRTLTEFKLSEKLSKTIRNISSWSNLELARRQQILIERRQNGFVRDCHGDLHLRNLAMFNGKILAFDCLEFNPEFRWIDVASELAFLLMDLARVGRIPVASMVLNRYLECTADYGLLQVLRFYLVYRAMVRAKVSALTLDENVPVSEREQAMKTYIDVALSTISMDVGQPSLILMFGFSGCGKSWLSKKLRMNSSVIHLRSDIVRNQMQDDADCLEADKYSSQSRSRVYIELEKLSAKILKEGYSVIVDATFLNFVNRESFQKLALKNKVNFHIVHLDYPVKVLEERIAGRSREGTDPSEADSTVLQLQLENYDPLSPEEGTHVIRITEKNALDSAEIEMIAGILGIG